MTDSLKIIGDNFEGRPAAIAGATAFSDPTIAHQTHSKTAQKILRVQKQCPAPTLFFGNLGFETTEASIRELLEAHRFIKKRGKDVSTEVEDKPKDVWIRKVRMGTFEDSGLCKGYLFVFLHPRPELVLNRPSSLLPEQFCVRRFHDG